MLSQLAVLGDAIPEKEAVKKHLRIVPDKYRAGGGFNRDHARPREHLH
jgi:hypothetical protein